MKEASTLATYLVRDLPEQIYAQLYKTNRKGNGLMQGALVYARGCEDSAHPTYGAQAIIATDQDGKLLGWALLHATGRRERAARYSRSFIYENISWQCYVFVRQSGRRRGVGMKLLASACELRPNVRVRPWNASSARFFQHAATLLPVRWESWESPGRHLPASERRAA